MTVRVVVVGAGVAGLTAAYRLLRAEEPSDVTVLEADGVLGGKLRSVRVGDLELEAGPDSFVARKPWAVELCRELGLGDRLEAPAASGAFVWTDHGLERIPRTALGVPTGLSELLTWKAMSRVGRFRALADLVRRARPPQGDESIGSLARRRLGEEATEVLIGPLLGGLHAGDVDRLSVAATFPELARWERDQGSLIRGAKAALAAAPDAGPMFLKPRDGTTALIEALVGSIGRERIRLAEPATGILAAGTGFSVRTGRGEIPADRVVLAAPAFAASGLLEDVAPVSAAELAAIPYASTGVALLVYPEGTGDALPASTGFVVPPGRAPMTACTFLSRKWPRPEYGTRAVVRCFVGGVGAEEVVDEPEEEIVAAVSRHIAAVLELPDRPSEAHVERWHRAMPQYEVGHRERLARIRDSLPPGIFVIGGGYDGVGVPDCVRGANLAAEAVLSHLAERSAGSERREQVR